ncbi:hypothetical protein EMCRGX_G018902 [Ephydatia muelleri]
MGPISSETGVQQGDPVGSLFFCLVLQKLVATIASDDESSQLLYHKWHVLCFQGCSKLVPKTHRLLTCCFASAVASVKWYTWARSTPPSLVAEALSIFDLDIHRCFTECTSVDISNVAWQQAQLSPSRGGLGPQSLLHQQAQLSPSRGGLGLQSLLHQQAQLSPSRGGLGLQSLLHHSSACFMASIGHSGTALGENHHLEQSIDEFNGYIAETEAICLQDILDAPLRQRYLSSKIEDHQLKVLFDLSSSPANRARLSSPHASAPLCVLSPCFGLAFGHASSPAELTP